MTQHDLPARFARASVFVAPFVRDPSGDQEGLPVALMEAVGCGCPAIAGAVPGLLDLLGEHHASVCVDPRDTEALGARIVEVLEDPDAAAARAAAIRRAAVERVDWVPVAAGYAALIRTGLASREWES